MNEALKQPFFDEEPFCEKLIRTGLPAVMYGTGDGADKLTELLENHGIVVSDYFASDGFVRDRFFHGKKVLSYSQICEKYDDFAVILGFATSRPEVLSNIRKIAAERLLIVPDGGVFEGDFVDRAWLADNLTRIERLWNSLADDYSRFVLESVMDFRLSGDIRYLDRSFSTPEELYRPLEGKFKSCRTVCDLGAFCGDTLGIFAGLFPKLSLAIALEPDPRTFAKLRAYSDTLPFKTETYNLAAWDCETELTFSCSASRATSVSDNTAGGGKTSRIPAATLDSLLRGRPADVVKLDVEGVEKEALNGCRETIARYNPDFIVSLYHRRDDILTLPELLSKLGSEKRLYLRRPEYLPAWDLILLATD